MIKRLSLVLLILSCLTSGVLAAASFNGSSSYVSVADNPALDVPDNNWTVAGWVQVNSNAGTSWNSMLDWWNNVHPEMRFWIGEASHAAYANDLLAWMADDDTDATNVGDGTNNNAFSGITVWTHVAFRRSGATFATFKNGVQVDSLTNANFDGITLSTNLILGASEAGTTQFLNGNLAEWVSWHKALSNSDIAALAKGFAPNCLPDFDWYVPLVRNYVELAQGAAVTNSGSTIAAHPRLYNCN